MDGTPPPGPQRHVNVQAILASVWIALASIGVLFIAYRVRKVLLYILIATLLAMVLDAPVVWLTRRKASRSFAIVTVLSVTTIVILGIGAGIAGPLSVQGVAVARRAPEYLKQAETGRGPVGQVAKRFRLQARLEQAGSQVSKVISTFSSRLVSLGRRVASTVVATALVIVLTIFLLADGPRLLETATRLVPPARRAQARRIGSRVAVSVSRYTAGLLLLAATGFVATALLLEVTNVPFALPLALWAGVAELLPVVGGLLGIIPAAIFAYAHSVPAAVVVIVGMFIYQQIKNHVLYPVVVGRAVRLSAVVTLVAVLAGVELGGIAGAVLAVPVVAALHAVAGELAPERFPWMRPPAPPQV